MEITSPVISLHGSGQTIVLENRFAGFMLSQGTTGLGVAPREVTTDPVASGGSILRHRRFEEAEMEIPIVLTGDYYTKRERRRKLEELVKGEVELRLRHPDGMTRSRFGYLTEGVEGDYSSGTDFQDAYKMVLSFVCPDPWWYGSERVLRQKVAAVRKPFITHTVEPVDTDVVNLWHGSKLSVNRDSLHAYFEESDIGTASQTSDGLEIELTSEIEETSSGVAVLQAFMENDSMLHGDDGDVFSASVPLRNTGDKPFPTGAALTGTNDNISDHKVLEPGETWIARIDGVRIEEDDGSLRMFIEQSEDEDPPEVGAKLTILDGITITKTETAHDPFNGDGGTPGHHSRVPARWLGEPGDSESVVVERSSVERAPFLPIVLASAVIEGAYQLQIQGDNDVWPVWEIEGPGEDLLLDNKTTGEVFFMEGEFEDNVTIDAKNMELSSPGLTNGELWDRVPATYEGKPNLPFKLAPGLNKVAISIVGASPESRVILRYREVWRSGQ